VPDTEEDPGGQFGLPAIVRGNDGVHEVKQPRRVVLHLDVNVKLYVAVLGLNDMNCDQFYRGWLGASLTLIRSSIV